MRNITTLLLGVALAVGSVATVEASPRHHSPYRPKPPTYRPAPPHYHPAPPVYRPSPRDRKEYRAQLRLRQLGFYNGRVDGQIGPMTQRAIVRYQRAYRLPVTGWLDVRTLRSLGVI